MGFLPGFLTRLLKNLKKHSKNLKNNSKNLKENGKHLKKNSKHLKKPGGGDGGGGGQIVNQGFWPGLWGQKIQFCSSTHTEKYNFTVLLRRTNTVLQFYWDGEKQEINACITNPIR